MDLALDNSDPDTIVNPIPSPSSNESIDDAAKARGGLTQSLSVGRNSVGSLLVIPAQVCLRISKVITFYQLAHRLKT